MENPPEIWFVLDGPLNASPSYWTGWPAIGLLGLVLAAAILAAHWASKHLPPPADRKVATAFLAATFAAFGAVRLWTGRHTSRGAKRQP